MPRKVRRDPGFRLRLRKAMSEADLRPSVLAKVLGVSDGTISRWRDGQLPDDWRFPAIAVALKVRTNWLKSGEEPVRTPTPASANPSTTDGPQGADFPPAIIDLTRDHSRRGFAQLYGMAVMEVGDAVQRRGTLDPERMLRLLTLVFEAGQRELAAATRPPDAGGGDTRAAG